MRATPLWKLKLLQKIRSSIRNLRVVKLVTEPFKSLFYTSVNDVARVKGRHLSTSLVAEAMSFLAGVVAWPAGLCTLETETGCCNL